MHRIDPQQFSDRWLLTFVWTDRTHVDIIWLWSTLEKSVIKWGFFVSQKMNWTNPDCMPHKLSTKLNLPVKSENRFE